jgi:NitT/TauT family transport system substrate-binding protein
MSGGGAPKNFRIATLTWVGYAPIYLAKEKGFFEGISVEPVLIEDTSSRRAALTSGTSSPPQTSSTRSRTRWPRCAAKAVLKLDDSMGGDGIVVKKQIASVKDLRGEDDRLSRRPAVALLPPQLLGDAGLKQQDIKASPMESADQAGAAFVSGSVDAAVTWSLLSQAAAAERQDPHHLARRAGPHRGYLHRPQRLPQKNPDVVKAFIQGWFKAIDYWKKNPRTRIGSWPAP